MLPNIRKCKKTIFIKDFPSKQTDNIIHEINGSLIISYKIYQNATCIRAGYQLVKTKVDTIN